MQKSIWEHADNYHSYTTILIFFHIFCKIGLSNKLIITIPKIQHLFWYTFFLITIFPFFSLQLFVLDWRWTVTVLYDNCSIVVSQKFSTGFLQIGGVSFVRDGVIWEIFAAIITLPAIYLSVNKIWFLGLHPCIVRAVGESMGLSDESAVPRTAIQERWAMPWNFIPPVPKVCCLVSHRTSTFEKIANTFSI